MMVTERLYYGDSHLTQFDGRIVSVAQTVDGRFAVTLDRTAFYPTGGGQPSDTGTLGDARVVDCVDEEERGVLHIIEGTGAPEVGASVTGRVDWPRRLDHIQQHTGQHILSQAFNELFRAETRSFRMLERVSEIDLALDEPSDERIERAVELANRIVWADRPLRVHHVTPGEAAQMPLRKDSAREGELRVIEIEGFDMSPCGGTHAARTGEVGIIAVRSWERAKGLTRVEFVAGGRVLADYSTANRTARGVAALFSVGRDEAKSSVERLLEEHKQLARRNRALEEVAARVEADELLAGAVPLGDGLRLVSRLFDGRDAEALKRLAVALCAQSRVVALLGSHDREDARFVFARSADAAAHDVGALMREACGMIDGRGGGRAEMAQGGGRASRQQLSNVMEAISRRLRGD